MSRPAQNGRISPDLEQIVVSVLPTLCSQFIKACTKSQAEHAFGNYLRLGHEPDLTAPLLLTDSRLYTMLPVMTASDEIVLRADNLSVTFDGRAVLEGFSLEVSSGQKVLMTGPSGCGKSTVLKCFLGLAVPKTGSVAIGGQPLTPTTVWSLRRKIAYVAQEPDLGRGIVRQVIEKPFQYRANAHLLGRLDGLNGLMDMFGLASELIEKNVSKLSGGEKQRIALIIAIMLDRPILMLDEPTSALDVRTREILSKYLQSRTDLTALAVAHDLGSFTFADNVVRLRGRGLGEPE